MYRLLKNIEKVFLHIIGKLNYEYWKIIMII